MRNVMQMPRWVKAVCIVLLLTAAGMQYGMGTERRAPKGHVVASPTPPDWLTHGLVPGNPEKAMADGARLYAAIQTFRDAHGGAFPTSPELTDDLLAYPRRYGFADMREAARGFRNPDTQYADDATVRRDGDAIRPWLNYKTRPDGSAVGANKPSGTRDVLSVCDLYVHMNVEHISGGDLTRANPVGFYLVVWDDGSVEKVLLKDTLRYAKGGSWYVAFKGQAGVPADALTFDVWRKTAVGRPWTSGM